MSFLLLLVLAILSFATLESKNSLLSRERLIAKQNAITGLYLAIGDLQKYLGPDQRATATADILEKNNAPYTVVWNSNTLKKWDEASQNWQYYLDNSSDDKAIIYQSPNVGGSWENNGDGICLPLVSMNKSSLGEFISSSGEVNEAVINNPVDLLGFQKDFDETSDRLKAERISITGDDDSTSGNYAWIVQDQSLKASIFNTHAGYVSQNTKYKLPETSRRLSVFPNANPSALTDNQDTQIFDQLDYKDNHYLNSLANCTSIHDLANLKISGSSDNLIPEDVFDETDLVLTTNLSINAKGILSDSRNGGLRKDLTRGLDDEYYTELHDRTVFGFDENEVRLNFDGFRYPIGDQWKFFRDFYNTYKSVDDGLVNNISSRNIFLGLDDVTSTNPSTPIRITNKDVSKHINYHYTNQLNRTDTTYSHKITPLTAMRSVAQPQSTSTSDAWYLYTPAIRPVVLRNTFKIGVKSQPDSATGKYFLQFELFPSMVIWNPFNFTVDLDKQRITNPMCVGNTMETHIHGNDRFVISVNNGSKHYAIRNGSWAPKVIALYEDLLNDSGLPNEMPPGAVWVLGLDKSYTADVEPIYQGGATLYPPSVTSNTTSTELSAFTGDKVAKASYNNKVVNIRPSTGYASNTTNLFPLYLASQSNGVSENNSITYNCRYLMTHDNAALVSGYREIGRGARKRVVYTTENSAVWEEALFDSGDQIKILNHNDRGDPTKITMSVTGEYDWTGKISTAPNSNKVEAFHHAENSDLRIPPKDLNVDIEVGTVGMLSSGAAFPFYQVDFIARTGSEEVTSGINNAAFPVFANVNFLGTKPLTVVGRDTVGDIKSLYIPQRVAANHSLDAIPERNNSTGDGFFGGSFNSSPQSSSKITLYDLPRHPIISISDFKNLTFSWFEDAPARPIGSSWPNPTLRRLDDLFTPIRGGSFSGGAGCDTSFFYNDVLYDQYFFSGLNIDPEHKDSVFPYEAVIDQDYLDGRLPLANTRLVNHNDPDLVDISTDGFEKTAANFLIDGVFNVNSTSSIAWQSILSGFRNEEIEGVSNDHTSGQLYEADGSAYVDNFIPSGDHNNLFSGYRRITDAEIEDLSEMIASVNERRGVSKTLGQFVNRSPFSGDPTEQSLGKLEEAIGLTSINQEKHQLANTTTIQDDIVALNPGSFSSQAALEVNNLAPHTGAGLPGYLKQQDILRPLAPIMTTRGDTFVVRAYGDSSGATNDLSTVRVVCEATVQRIPEYVDGSIDPWEKPLKNSSNDLFGRKFKIISFKWIDLDDV